jgi:hypothetical protein
MGTEMAGVGYGADGIDESMSVSDLLGTDTTGEDPQVSEDQYAANREWSDSQQAAGMSDEEFGDFNPLTPEAQAAQAQDAAAGEEPQQEAVAAPQSSGKGKKAKAVQPALPETATSEPASSTYTAPDGKKVVVRDASVPNTPADAPTPPKPLTDAEKEAAKKVNALTKTVTGLSEASVPAASLIRMMEVTQKFSLDQLRGMIGDYGDEDLLALDLASKGMESASWQLKAGVRGEIVRRIQMKAAAAATDPQSQLINAEAFNKANARAIRQAAEVIGVSERTLYDDADLNNTYFIKEMTDPETGKVISREAIEQAIEAFSEKSFVLACMRARPNQRQVANGVESDNLPNGHNPQSVLILLSSRKIDNPRYSVRDCMRDVDLIRENKIAAAMGRESVPVPEGALENDLGESGDNAGGEGAGGAQGKQEASSGKINLVKFDPASVSPDASYFLAAAIEAAQDAKRLKTTHYVYRNLDTQLWASHTVAPTAVTDLNFLGVMFGDNYAALVEFDATTPAGTGDGQDGQEEGETIEASDITLPDGPAEPIL